MNAEVLVELIAPDQRDHRAFDIGLGAAQHGRTLGGRGHVDIGIFDIRAVGMLDDQRGRELVAELVLVAEGQDVEVIGDIAGLAQGRAGGNREAVGAAHIRVGDLQPGFGIVAFFEQDIDRLGRTLDPGCENGCRA